MHLELVRTFSLNEAHQNMLLCQSQKFCRKHVCLREALIREVFKIQGSWSLLKAKTEKACSLFENPRFFISNQLFLKNIQEVLVLFPCQLKTMLTPQKLPWSNYHPLKGMLTKAIPASSLQLHRAPGIDYGEFRSWRTGMAWVSVVVTGSSHDWSFTAWEIVTNRNNCFLIRDSRKKKTTFHPEKEFLVREKIKIQKSNIFQNLKYGGKLGGPSTCTST